MSHFVYIVKPTTTNTLLPAFVANCKFVNCNVCSISEATGDAGDTTLTIFGQLVTKCLISPKVCKNCYQISCGTDAYGATSVCGTSKTPRQSKRE